MGFFNTDGLGNNLLGAGIDFLSARYNNKMAAEREAAAREENYKYGEMAANAADIRTRELYGDLYSPGAQMQQIKKAGLSPSIYASGGIAGKSGVSGAMGTGSGAVGPQTYGINPLAAAQVKSQIDLNKAQARKLNTEADTTEGKNQRGQAEISNLLAQNGLTKASTAYTQAQTETQQWQNYITSSTADFSIKTCEYMSYKSAYEMEETYWKAANEKQDYKFNQETFEARVGQEKETWVNLQFEALQKNANIKLTKAQTELVKGELSMLYDTSMREWAQLDVNRADQETRAKLINKQVENFERQLDQKDKELRIENRNSWFNNINNSIRTVAYSASCVASFIPLSGESQLPPATLEPNGVNQYY